MPFFLKEFSIAKRKISCAAIFWFLLAIVAIFIQIKKGPGSINNYLIYKGVFWHTWQQVNLYIDYPAEYFDLNHYGPFFSLIIAPFALLPDTIGCMLWGLANAVFLFYAVRRLPVSYTNQNIILLIGAVEMMTAMHNMQFNPMLTSWILFSYILVYKKMDFWATLFIAAGILTKIYGIVGLAFFLFSDKKVTFIVSFLFWLAVLFCLPMLFSSPSFILQSYKDWYTSITEKNDINSESTMQGFSVMRLVKRTFQLPALQDIYFLFAAAVLYLAPLARFRQLKFKGFQISYLAFLLIGVVIFSSSAESPTYVIALTGIGIWFILQEKKPWAWALLAFAIILTTLSTTDLFPKWVKVDYVRPYALKALPCLLIWLVLAYQLLFKNFTADKTISDQASAV